MSSQAARRVTFFFLMAVSAVAVVNGQDAFLRIPLDVFDAGHHRSTVYFGVHPLATDCVDPPLDEYILPTDECRKASPCVRFVDPWVDRQACLGDGLLLDLRAYRSSTQVDSYVVAFSAGEYPVVFYWPDNLGDYYDGVRISDEFGGTLFAADMITDDSLVIGNTGQTRALIVARGPHGTSTGISAGETETPTRIALDPNYPNPLNPTTTIRFWISADRLGSGEPRHVSLKVFDVLGREVATLVEDELTPGEYTAMWDAGQIDGRSGGRSYGEGRYSQASGLYFCRLDVGGRSAMIKMVLAR